jgi:hypothetical protein
MKIWTLKTSIKRSLCYGCTSLSFYKLMVMTKKTKLNIIACVHYKIVRI